MYKGSLVKLRSLPIENGKTVLLEDCDSETQSSWSEPAVVVRGPYECSFRREFDDGSKLTTVYRACDIMHKCVLYEKISVEHLERVG